MANITDIDCSCYYDLMNHYESNEGLTTVVAGILVLVAATSWVPELGVQIHNRMESQRPEFFRYKDIRYIPSAVSNMLLFFSHIWDA